MKLPRFFQVSMVATALAAGLMVAPFSAAEAQVTAKPPSVYLRDLGVRGAGAHATLITDSGLMAGYFEINPDPLLYPQTRAWRWTNGKMTELKSLGNDTTLPVAVNDGGQILGQVGPRSARFIQVVRWEPTGAVVTLTQPAGTTLAVDINNSGIAVGQRNVREAFNKSVRWGPNQLTDLTSLNSYPARINNKGEIAITLSDYGPFFAQRAAVWRNGVFSELPRPADAYTSVAVDINNRGVIAGTVQLNTDYSIKPVLWEGGKVRYVGNVNGITVKINDRGDVLARSLDEHTVLIRDGIATVLPDVGPRPGSVTSSFPKDMNNKGQIIGWSGYENTGNGKRTDFPVLWQDGVVMKLPTLGGTTAEALDINNRGQIVGYSKDKAGVDHAVLWTVGGCPGHV